MRTATTTGILILIIATAAGSAYLLAKRNATAAAPPANASNAPIGVQAMVAYKSGDYATALPLLKQWAKSPEIRADKQRQTNVLTYIINAEQKLAPPATAPSVADLAAAATNPANIDPTTQKPRIPHQPIPAGQLASMGIRDLGNFEFDPTADTDIPPDVKALNGATLRLRGFMIPLTQAEDITDFALVPTLANCCFGQPPGVQHTITCKTQKGRAVQYTVDEVSIEGKLTINVKRDQGYTYSIFEMEVTSVKPVE